MTPPRSIAIDVPPFLRWNLNLIADRHGAAVVLHAGISPRFFGLGVQLLAGDILPGLSIVIGPLWLSIFTVRL